MGKVEITMPKMGESVAEATVIKWLKQVGEKVEADEAVLEIATDKVDSEIPSPEEGVLLEQRYQENDVVKVGDVIAVLEVEGAASTASSAPEPPKEEPKEEPQEELVTEAVSSVSATPSPSSNGSTTEIPRVSGDKFYSPLVRSIASKEGVSVQELDTLPGSGLNDRVTKKDILNYIETRTSGGGGSVESPAREASTPSAPQEAPKSVQTMEGDEIVEMDRMRKLIADHMVMSKHTSPHVTSMVEADVTNIVNWRNAVKDEFQKKEGEKITFTPIFFEIIARAIREMPGVNVSIEGKNIIKRKHINLGMATALPSGNLIVPVIRDADQKNLLGLTKSINDMAARARVNKLSPDEISGGTFTITNVGTFGNVMGTPIINQPQVAIMALGAIRKKPAVIETEYGDTIGIRHMMYISMSYDHRVVDGALGGKFIRLVGDMIEAFDPDRSL